MSDRERFAQVPHDKQDTGKHHTLCLMNAIWEKNLHIYWYEICTIYIQYSTLMGTNIPKMVLKNPLHLYYCFEMPDCEVLIWFTYSISGQKLNILLLHLLQP